MAQKKPQIKLPIYCIGDSHTSFFSGSEEIVKTWPYPHFDRHPLFRAYRLGPVTAHNLQKKTSTTQSNKNLFKILKTLPNNSTLMLIFGEIDCRVHLPKIAKSKRSEAIRTTVQRYVKVCDQVKKLGHNVIILSVIPAGNVPPNKDFPSHGSLKLRNSVTDYFNSYLLKQARKKNLFYLDFNSCLKKDQTTNFYFYSDGMHLSQKAMKLFQKKLSLKFELIESSESLRIRYFIYVLQVLIFMVRYQLPYYVFRPQKIIRLLYRV